MKEEYSLKEIMEDAGKRYLHVEMTDKGMSTKVHGLLGEELILIMKTIIEKMVETKQVTMSEVLAEITVQCLMDSKENNEKKDDE